MWTPIIATSGKPVYQLIADAMEVDIAANRLKPGEQLPTHRELARHLNLTVRTVTRAYSEAERRGLTAGQIGRGTFVRQDALAARRESGTIERRIIDLSSSTPPISAAASFIADTMRDLAEHGDLQTLLSYPPSVGTLRHRAVGAAWLSRRDWNVAPEQIVICVGAQHALMAALATVAPPASVVLTEALNYPGIRRAADALRLDLRGVPIDEEGMQPDALDSMIQAMKPAAIVVTPTAHNPTSVTMSESRRLSIARTISAHDIPLIEDDLAACLSAEIFRCFASSWRDAPSISAAHRSVSRRVCGSHTSQRRLGTSRSSHRQFMPLSFPRHPSWRRSQRSGSRTE